MKVSSVKEGKGSFLCLFRCNNGLEREFERNFLPIQLLHLDFHHFIYVSPLEEVGERDLIFFFFFSTLIKRVSASLLFEIFIFLYRIINL